MVDGHRADPIHVFSAVVQVANGTKKKQIIMLAVTDARRDAELADFRDTDLEVGGISVRMREFRQKMKAKWPDIG